MVDFNDASPQRSFEVIPAGTVAELHLKVRPGKAGEDGWLRRSKDGNSEALDLECTVVRGPYAKRKFWCLLTVSGTTEGHEQAAELSRSRLRAILESARGIRPDDMSDAAKQARQVGSYAEFDGLCFIGRIGVEPARDNYRAKNTLLAAVTPDQQDWHRVEQVVKHSDVAAPAKTSAKPATPDQGATKIVKPPWAS
jgi:hypothetical protein